MSSQEAPVLKDSQGHIIEIGCIVKRIQEATQPQAFGYMAHDYVVINTDPAGVVMKDYNGHTTSYVDPRKLLVIGRANKTTTFTTSTDAAIVNKPDHYDRFPLEPVEFIMGNNLPFHVGNIIKYVMRAGHKLYPGKTAAESEVIDLKKVRRYAEMRIQQIEADEPYGWS